MKEYILWFKSNKFILVVQVVLTSRDLSEAVLQVSILSSIKWITYYYWTVPEKMPEYMTQIESPEYSQASPEDIAKTTE